MTTTVFNFLLLRLAGNVGVAAYGVVANFALVATAIFNGVAQGAQPLISQCYGKNEMTGAKGCFCWAAALRWRWRRCCTVPCLALPIPLLPSSTARALL